MYYQLGEGIKYCKNEALIHSVNKNCKVEHLQTGVGEVVCHLIDELLNVELFRREYQFGMPQFPTDDDNLEEDQADDGGNLDGEQEMFGIKIKQETDKADLVNGTVSKRKRL